MAPPSGHGFAIPAQGPVMSLQEGQTILLHVGSLAPLGFPKEPASRFRRIASGCSDHHQWPLLQQTRT